jgi:hypothetical protein
LIAAPNWKTFRADGGLWSGILEATTTSTNTCISAGAAVGVDGPCELRALGTTSTKTIDYLGKSISSYYVENIDLCAVDCGGATYNCTPTSAYFLDTAAFTSLNTYAEWKFLKDE